MWNYVSDVLPKEHVPVWTTTNSGVTQQLVRIGKLWQKPELAYVCLLSTIEMEVCIMTLLFLVWLADASSSVSFAIGALGYVGMAGVILLGLYLHDKNKSLWTPVMAGIVCLAFMLLAAAIPSKQGVYQLMAAYGAVETVQYLQQSDDAKRIAGKSIQAIEKMLDDAIKEDKK